MPLRTRARRQTLPRIPIRTAFGPLWQDEAGAFRASFLGRGGPGAGLAALVEPFTAPRQAPSWLTQVHGATVLEASAGHCGRGDALVSDRGDLSLAVATSDCVPVLLATASWCAAVHAGWRGIVAGVVPAAVPRLEPGGSPLTAWIGPAIGVCCYEVGEDVAEALVRACDAPGCLRRVGGRPHLDLRAAVEAQLVVAGVTEVRHLDLCTRCHPDLLWSYRRDGPRAGRNAAWIARVLDPGGFP